MKLNVTLIPGMNVPMVSAEPKRRKIDTITLFDLINMHKTEIIKQLYQYGAILFRGFACQDAEHFSKAIELCDLGTRGNTIEYDLPRTYLANEICISTDLPPHVPLPLHHEKPRSIQPPSHIYFCCATPATIDGGTLFANAEDIWLDIPKTIQDKIMEHGVVYKQFFHGKTMRHSVLKKILGKPSVRSWSEYFGTDNKSEIEEQLIQNNLTCEWVKNSNDLIILNKLPGALKHQITNKICWFNAANYLNNYSNVIYGQLKTLPFYKYIATKYLISKDILPLVCHYGNGYSFSSDDIEVIDKILQQHTHVLNWQQGDFMIVDNVTFMHGKQTHQGDRLLYSCITH
jgi:alpha-ketoglutarate-dependent taurine dioxygenase